MGRRQLGDISKDGRKAFPAIDQNAVGQIITFQSFMQTPRRTLICMGIGNKSRILWIAGNILSPPPEDVDA